MEITTKQKMIVTIIMAVVFAGSILLKYQFQQQKGFSVAATGTLGEGTEQIDDLAGREPLEEDLSLIVDVEGAVRNPGVVHLSEGSRVYQAIEKAGGVLENADTKYINQAELVTDGIIIYVPYLEGRNGMVNPEESETISAGAVSGASFQQNFGSGNGTETTRPVNINTADRETLMTLPGIGESYAAAIIDYREQNGFFQSVEELKQIEGIGERKFEKLKDRVSVY